MEKLVKYYGRKLKLSKTHKSEVEYPYRATIPKTKIKVKGSIMIKNRKQKKAIVKTITTVEQLEKNINYFITHKDEKIRFEATKAFVDYFKPKKKDVHLEGNVGASININLSGLDEAKYKKMFVK